MKNKFKILIIFLLFNLIGCSQPKDDKYLGYVNKLPKGEYIIYNYGSRHIVKCVKPDGTYYCLNDGNFELNGIPGRDAHEYHEKTRLVIK